MRIRYSIIERIRRWRRLWYRGCLLASYGHAQTATGIRLDIDAHRWIGPRAVGETDAGYRKRLLEHLKMRWLHS